jgi:hypothetical protein
MTTEQETRQQIAMLLTGRCNNCYSRLPGEVGCSVHSPGWHWLTPNFGPFCDDCWTEATAKLAATHAAIRALPRHSACDITDRFQRWVGGNDEYVRWEGLARLLGDPAQEHP